MVTTLRVVMTMKSSDPQTIEELKEFRTKILSGEFQRDMVKNNPNTTCKCSVEIYPTNE